MCKESKISLKFKVPNIQYIAAIPIIKAKSPTLFVIKALIAA